MCRMMHIFGVESMCMFHCIFTNTPYCKYMYLYTQCTYIHNVYHGYLQVHAVLPQNYIHFL